MIKTRKTGEPVGHGDSWEASCQGRALLQIFESTGINTEIYSAICLCWPFVFVRFC